MTDQLSESGERERIEHQFTTRMKGSITDYHIAPGGDGPLGAEWEDKPHRLLYDVLGEVQYLRTQLRAAESAIQKAHEAQTPKIYHHTSGNHMSTCGVPLQRGESMPEWNHVNCSACYEAVGRLNPYAEKGTPTTHD